MLTYTNPIINQYLADPCMVWDEVAGAYFLFATGRASDGRGVPIHRSPDLVNWAFVRGAVAPGGATAWNHKHFWAPEVVKIGGVYHLYYTASPEESPKNSGNRVGLAVAKNIEGPYEDRGVVIPNASIDGHPFFDDDGTMYLFYTVENLSRDGLTAGQIYAYRMQSPEKVEGEPRQIISHHSWQEGPWLQKHHGKYILTYSCGSWGDQTYHVRYAIGDPPSPFGPFKEQPTNVLQSTAAVKGPGHHSMFRDRAGKDWICYHGWDPKFTARYPRVDRIYFVGDRIVSDGPTSTPQPVPFEEHHR